MRRCTRFAVVALFGSFLSTIAGAATITVSPTGSVTTLGMALTLADPGDTIVMKAGVYYETVVVPGNLDDLTIKGLGKVVLDCRTAAGLALGGGMVISADGVTISNLTIRHAATDLGDEGNGIRSTGLNTTISKCRFLGHESSAVLLGGTGARIEQCAFGVGPAGVELNAAIGTTISKCTFRDAFEQCVVSSGATNTVIDKCTFDRSSGGIDADEALVHTGLTVSNCKFRALGGWALQFEGSGLTVTKNSFASIAGGISAINATTLAITKSSFANASGVAVRLEGVTDANVEQCTAQDCNSSVVSIIQSSSDLAVRSCKFKRVDTAVTVDTGNNVELTSITATDCVFGFILDATTVVATQCLSKNSDSDGFRISVGSTNVQLTKCQALNSAAEGIENRGPSTSATNCTFKGSRLDVTNDGALTLTNCMFVSGGTTTPPALD